MVRYFLALSAALVLLTGCSPSTQEDKKPAEGAAPPPVAAKPETSTLPARGSETDPATARLVAETIEKQRKAVVVPVQTLFACDFEKAETNKVPADFLVLDGGFTVREEDGHRFLELPGAPLDNFGLLFGPTCSNRVSVYARVFGTNRGRREPVFGVGLGGAGGLKLMVAPGKRLLELWRGDERVAQAPYTWETGKWTWMRLQLRPVGVDEWMAEGRAWKEGTPEPPAGQVMFRDKSDLPSGRAAVWGSPISGTPIRFDDLKLTVP